MCWAEGEVRGIFSVWVTDVEQKHFRFGKVSWRVYLNIPHETPLSLSIRQP
jgi:hypothetical protein